MMDAHKVGEIARLAHIEISQKEKEALVEDLSQVFSWVDQICAVSKLDAPEEETQKSSEGRADMVTEENSREDIVGQAPHGDGVFFIVPRII